MFRICSVVLLLALAGAASAQPVYPARPGKLDVQLRYRIRADRDERVRQFRELERDLKAIGFARTRKEDDDLDLIDPTAERFEGQIDSKNVEKLLDNPWVKTILFKPTDFQYPADAAVPVPIRIRIAGGYLAGEQQKLHSQVAEQLAKMGFREFIGYDHDRFTLLRGDLPAGNLPRLLKDLRTEPTGWFLPDTMPRELPAPLKDTLPIRWVEVLPGADLTLLPAPTVAPNRVILSPDLRAVLDDPAQAAKPIRVEVVMDRRLTSEDLDHIRTRLRGQYSREVVNPATGLRDQQSATLEGAVGNVATIHFLQAADADRAQQEVRVVAMRLPREAVQTVVATPANVKEVPAADALAAARLAEFHKLGYRGQGTRIVIIASEFPGLGTVLGQRFLDTTLRTPVKFIDLTAETNANLIPAPAKADATAGTAAARAAHLAAPDATLVLVRVDASSHYQVNAIAKFVRGDSDYTEAMKSRVLELFSRKEELDRKNAQAVEEYRRAFADFSDEEAPKQRRARAKQVLEALIVEEAAHTDAILRATKLQQQMRDLLATDIVVNTLVWETGFELDGLSELAQNIESSYAGEAFVAPRNRSATRPKLVPRPIWVQAASPSAGSVWSGPFLDRENNGAMEFAGGNAKLAKGQWTRELNFLGTRTPDGTQTPNLATGTKVRLSVQWREAHDPEGYGGVSSIFPLTLRVMQQLDPEGKVRASDELKEIARSAGSPIRIYAEPTFGIYEQSVEFIVPADGRYALRIEGATTYDSRLPALQRHIEVNPRMHAEFIGAAPDKGRPVFASEAPANAGVGIPGDAKAAITVAPLAGGLTGGGPGLQLLVKPDLRAESAIDTGAKVAGPGVSAGFAAGALADLLSSGAPPADILGATGLPRGGPLAIPANWLKVVPVRK
jgi:hypothetical protein